MIESLNSERKFNDPKDIVFPAAGLPVFVIDSAGKGFKFHFYRISLSDFILIQEGSYTYYSKHLPLCQHNDDCVPVLKEYFFNLEDYAEIKITNRTFFK